MYANEPLSDPVHEGSMNAYDNLSPGTGCLLSYVARTTITQYLQWGQIVVAFIEPSCTGSLRGSLDVINVGAEPINLALLAKQD